MKKKLRIIPKLCNTKYKAFKLRNPSVILGSGCWFNLWLVCCYGDECILATLAFFLFLFFCARDVIKHLGRSKPNIIKRSTTTTQNTKKEKHSLQTRLSQLNYPEQWIFVAWQIKLFTTINHLSAEIKSYRVFFLLVTKRLNRSTSQQHKSTNITNQLSNSIRSINMFSSSSRPSRGCHIEHYKNLLLYWHLITLLLLIARRWWCARRVPTATWLWRLKYLQCVHLLLGLRTLVDRRASACLAFHVDSVFRSSIFEIFSFSIGFVSSFVSTPMAMSITRFSIVNRRTMFLFFFSRDSLYERQSERERNVNHRSKLFIAAVKLMRWEVH